MEGRITGHTGLLALIGSPVGHSGSPAMYNYSFEKLGLDYAYVAFDIKGSLGCHAPFPHAWLQCNDAM